MHPVLFHIGSILIPSYGALAAIGVLAALFLAQRTARIAHVDAGQVWNLCILSLFAALIGERLVLIAANWRALRSHPAWAFALATIHHPLLAFAGVFAGAAVAAWYIRRRRMPGFAVADALAAPLALGLAFEQVGALLAGSGYGTQAGSSLPWAVTYRSIFAARWSGAPLGIPLHPVQAYAALGFFALAIFLLLWMAAPNPRAEIADQISQRQSGDAAGLCLMGLGVVIYFTELWRAAEGRGSVLHGAIDGPQIAAALLVIAGGFVLRQRKANGSGLPPFLPHSGEKDEAQDESLKQGNA